MSIIINKLENNKLNKDEIIVNLESSKKNNDIDNLIDYINGYNERYIIVNDDYKLVQIDINDIICFYSDGRYNYCKTTEKEFRVKSKLYELEKKSKDFLRISKSSVINIKQVECFDTGENRKIIVKFYDGSVQKVSRRKIKEVMSYLDERRL